MTNIPGTKTKVEHTRQSPDSIWPLRGEDGLTFAERKARRDKEKNNDPR